jgi:bifunctional DNase/RNase
VLSHRARRRLREELAAEWRPRIQKKGTAMIEVTVQDVMLREQPGDAEARTVQPHFSGWVVFLKSRSDDRAIAIWLGATEGEAVAMHLGSITAPRPPTYTFMANLLNGLGAAVKAVAITDLTNETFMASVTLQSKDRTIEIDARPSDAINLALRTGAAIVVAEAIFERVGFETRDNTVEQWRAMAQASSGQREPDNSKWLSGIEVARERHQRGQEQLERLRAAVDEQRRSSERSGEAPG